MATRTIQSPGVEIRERDLSLRAPQNLGTNFFLTGFAQQGPVDEVLKITTKQELEQIFGVPTTSAERYFFHTCTELLNSPGNVYATRMPYGADLGDGFGSKYSALAYPVVAATGGTLNGLVSAYNLSFNYDDIADTDVALSGAAFNLKLSNSKIKTVVFDIDGDGPLYAGDWVVPIAFDDTVSDVLAAVSSYVTASAAAASGGITFTSVDSNTYKIALSGFISATDSIAVSGSVYTNLTNVLTVEIESNQTVSYDLDITHGTYVLGKPTHIELTESQYLSVLAGKAFDWETTGGVIDGISSMGKAGVVVLNKAQTTINGGFEGYYVGLLDNTNIDPASEYNGIKTIKTIVEEASTTTDYTTIPTGTLQFKVSSNNLGATNSISEVMEKLTNYDISGHEDDDVLSIGVFKLRKSVFATQAFKLDYVLEDAIVGSINAFRTELNPNGGPNVPFFISTRDEKSRNVEILINDTISNRLEGGDALDENGNPTTKIRVYTDQLAHSSDDVRGFNISIYNQLADLPGFEKADSLFALGAYSNSTTKLKLLGDIPRKLQRVLEGVKNDDIYELDVIVEAGLGTIYAAASASNTPYYDEFRSDSDLISAVDGLRTSNSIEGTTAQTLRDSYTTIFNLFELFCSPPYLGGGRGDCLFVADALRHIFITGADTKTLTDKTKNFQTHVYWPIRHQFANENTSYACVYANWAKVYDPFIGQQVWVPFSGFAAAAMARTDALTFPWFAPAGFERGLVQFANDIAINPNQKQRDELYKSNINPVSFFPAQGQVIFGQKTLSRRPSAFDRINVRRLFLTLERPTKKASMFFVFEQNTEFTRNRLINTLTPLFERAKNNQGLYDYLIICDERNNTPEVIDNNELVVDIYIKPTRTTEFILVNFYATRTDANFQELIGN